MAPLVANHGAETSLCIVLSGYPCQDGFYPDNLIEECAMTAYIPALIWTMSAFACLFIAKRRNLKTTTSMAAVVTLLGPLAIPLVLALKPVKRNDG